MVKNRLWAIAGFGLLTVAMVISLAASGRAGSTKTVELKFASISSPTHVLNTDLNQPWIDKVQEAAKGKLKITLYPAGALGKAKEAYEIAAKGIAEISYGLIIYQPGQFLLSEVYQLPGSVKGKASAYHIYDVYQKYLKTEFKDTKVLWLGLVPGAHIFMKNKQVRTIDDVKNVKLGIQGALPAQIAKAMGAVPVEVPAQDLYVSLQRGTIDGGLLPWSSIAGNKLGEVAKYYTEASLFNYVFYAVMNLNTYNSLPSDVKKIIDDNTDRKAWEFATDAYFNSDTVKSKEVIQQSGKQGVVYALPGSELARYRQMVAPITDKWLANAQAKKLPAKETLDMVLGYLK